jgi:hypothetical protein
MINPKIRPETAICQMALGEALNHLIDFDVQ